MNREPKRLDTLKAKDGNVYRIMQINDDGTVAIKGVNRDTWRNKPGKSRIIKLSDIGETYTLLDLGEVTESKIDDLPSKKVEVKQVPTPSEKASQIEKQTVTGYNDKGKDEQIVNLKKTIGKMQQHIDQLKQTNRELHNILDEQNRKLEDIRLKEEPVDIEALREDLKIAQKLAMSRGEQNDVLADELDEEHAKRILLEHKLAGITEFVKAIMEPRRVM